MGDWKITARVRWLSSKMYPFAKFATYVMAITGVLGLGLPVLSRRYAAITGADAMGAVRPICEQYLPLLPDGSKPAGDAALVGAEVLAVRSISQLRITMNGIYNVQSWGMKSTGLSNLEQKDFLARLPRGLQSGSNLTTPEFPPLPEGSITRITAMAGIVYPEVCSESDWLNVSTPSGKVYVTDPTFQRARGSVWFTFDPRVVLPTAILVGLLILVFKYRKPLARAFSERP